MSALALIRSALESLRDERRRVALAVLGVAIGVASIVLLVSIGAGARAYVKEQFGGAGSDVLVVLPGHVETSGAIPGVATGTPHPLTIEDARALRRSVKGVAAVAPLSMGTGRVAYAGRSRDSIVLGTTAEFATVRRVRTALGHFLPRDEQAGRADESCVLGDSIARELFRGESPLGLTVRIASRSFRVVGVLEPRGRQQGFDMDELVYVAEPAARALFNLRGLYRVLVLVAAVEDEDEVARSITAFLRARHRALDFTILTAGAVLESLGRIVSVFTAVLAGIAAVSLVVGGIGIANVALVAAVARTEEVGIKKALGAHPSWVFAQLLLESALAGGAGGVLGAGAAAALALGARQLSRGTLPLETPPWAVLLAVLGCAGVGVVAGGIPALRAASLDPVRALRVGGGGSK